MVGGFAITVIVVYFNVSFNMKLRCKKENEEQRNIVDSDAWIVKSGKVENNILYILEMFTYK